MRELVQSIIDQRPSDVHIEARYHSKKEMKVLIKKGVLQTAKIDKFEGIGIRVLAEGAWGYASTSKLEQGSVTSTLKSALAAAKTLGKKKPPIELARIKPISGNFKSLGKDPIKNHSIEDCIELALESDKAIMSSDQRIKGSEVLIEIPTNHKIIMNTDGTDAQLHDTRPGFSIRAVASEGAKIMPYLDFHRICGGWEAFDPLLKGQMITKVTDTAIKLLDAPLAKAGNHTVVLSPDAVGLLCHEAIGHTVECDLVLAGSAAKNKIGKEVATEHVTLVDSGDEPAAGWLPVDDAGVKTQRTVIIDHGVMKSYLHSRSSAHHFNVEPTGNERAFEFNLEPMIRMRNTYLEPGDYTQEELVEDIDFGYLCAKRGGGTSDASAEFMLGSLATYEIKNGEIGNLVKNVTFTGNAYDVLQTIDAVSKEWEVLGGSCWKMQPARIGGGGGSIRAIMMVSGDIGGS
ncbi:MAG: TldD/PmbA family protein [Candidatus Hodarchaeota archaeon]